MIKDAEHWAPRTHRHVHLHGFLEEAVSEAIALWWVSDNSPCLKHERTHLEDLHDARLNAICLACADFGWAR